MTTLSYDEYLSKLNSIYEALNRNVTGRIEVQFQPSGEIRYKNSGESVWEILTPPYFEKIKPISLEKNEKISAILSELPLDRLVDRSEIDSLRNEYNVGVRELKREEANESKEKIGSFKKCKSIEEKKQQILLQLKQNDVHRNAVFKAENKTAWIDLIGKYRELLENYRKTEKDFTNCKKQLQIEIEDSQFEIIHEALLRTEAVQREIKQKPPTVKEVPSVREEKKVERKAETKEAKTEAKTEEKEEEKKTEAKEVKEEEEEFLSDEEVIAQIRQSIDKYERQKKKTVDSIVKNNIDDILSIIGDVQDKNIAIDYASIKSYLSTVKSTPFMARLRTVNANTFASIMTFILKELF